MRFFSLISIFFERFFILGFFFCEEPTIAQYSTVISHNEMNPFCEVKNMPTIIIICR